MCFYTTTAEILFSTMSERKCCRRHVNIQAIAEEHYERYLDQEEEAVNKYRTDNVTATQA